jgi:type IV pilus assembly protein PilQ
VIQDGERNTSYKVPLLGDIPILGALFRGSETLRERREVIVVLTPKIIGDTQFSTAGYGISKP